MLSCGRRFGLKCLKNPSNCAETQLHLFQNMSIRLFSDEAREAREQKKKPTQKPNEPRNTKSEEDELLEAYHTVIDTAVEISRKRRVFPPEVAAEHARIGREYNRQMFIQHNQHVKDITLKIYLQQDAMKALPPHLYELASEVDETPPPRNRPYPIWYTPPVPGLFLVDPDGEENEEQTMALEKGHYITDKYTNDNDDSYEDLDEDGEKNKDDDDDDAEY